MVLNLLNVASYWFDKTNGIPWINESWTPWLWLGIAVLGVLFLLTIIGLFVKAIRRTRERRFAKSIAREVASLVAIAATPATVEKVVEKIVEVPV